MLPDFKGILRPASWSGFKLTAQIEANLRQAASPKCPQCAGAGYLDAGAKILLDTVQLCPCVHRAEERRGR